MDMQPFEQCVGGAPVVRRVRRVRCSRGAAERNVVPTERVTDDVDAKPVERREPLFERSGLWRPDLDPSVVLDAVLRLVGRVCGRCRRGQRDKCRSDDETGPHLLLSRSESPISQEGVNAGLM